MNILYNKFIQLCIDDDIESIKDMISKGYDINYLPTKLNISGLFISMKNQNPKLMKELLLLGSDVNVKTSQCNLLQQTILQKYINFEIFNLLIENKININYIGPDNKTCLEMLTGFNSRLSCSYEERIKAVNILLENNVSMNFTNLIRACLYNETYLIKLFMKNFIYNNYDIIFNMNTMNIDTIKLLSKIDNFNIIFQNNRDFFENSTDDDVISYIKTF